MAAMLLGGGGTRKGGKKAKAALNKQGEAKRAKKAKRSARADSPGSQQRAAGGRSPMRPMTFVSVGTVSVDDSTAHIQVRSIGSVFSACHSLPLFPHDIGVW
jgi:hypothetical protein